MSAAWVGITAGQLAFIVVDRMRRRLAEQRARVPADRLRTFAAGR